MSTSKPLPTWLSLLIRRSIEECEEEGKRAVSVFFCPTDGKCKQGATGKVGAVELIAISAVAPGNTIVHAHDGDLFFCSDASEDEPVDEPDRSLS